MAWNSGLPTTGTKMVDTATLYPDNWIAIEEWLDIEHYDPTDPTSGWHKPGLTAVMSASTTTVITSATILSSTPGTGAIGWSTDRGHGMVFISGGWSELPSAYPESDVNVYLKTPLATSYVRPNVWAFNGDTEDFDPRGLYLSGAAGTYGYITATRTGLYMVTSTFTWSPSTNYTNANRVSLAVQSFTPSNTVTKTLAATEYFMAYEGDGYGITTPKHTLQVVGTLALTAGDRIQMYVYTDFNVTPSGADGIRTTALSIKRVE